MVCAKCGLVLGPNFVEPLPLPASLNIHPELSSICERLHTPYQNEIASCYDHLTHLPHPYRMGVALYTTLNRLGTPKSLGTIAYLCQLSSRQLWRKMRHMDINDSFNYENFAEAFLAPLNLSFSAITQIKKRADSFPSSFRPQTVLTTLAYLHIKGRGKELSLQKLSKQLHVSSMSAFRCLKAIERQHASPPSREV